MVPLLNRRPPVLIPSISLDRNLAEPLQGQLQRQLRTAITSGELKHGARLPSSRTLAKLLGVSRNTVCLAYDELVQEDLLCGEPGAGTRVKRARNGFGIQPAHLKRLLRAANFPARAVFFSDPDGNAFYLNL